MTKKKANRDKSDDGSVLMAFIVAGVLLYVLYHTMSFLSTLSSEQLMPIAVGLVIVYYMTGGRFFSR